jgi:hypothetical protein
MLVVDRREIEFDGDALSYYLSASPREAGALGLPPIAASEIRFNAKDGIVDFLFARPSTTDTVHVSADQLGGLLISYCLRSRIPMPRVADKVIRVEPNRIVLTFKTWFTEAPVFAPMEAAARAVEAVKSWKWVEPGQAAHGV